MITLNAKLREPGNYVEADMIAAVVYGPGVKNANIQVNEKEFIKVLREAGESSLVELLVGDPASAEGSGEAMEKRPVLIKDVQRNPVYDNVIHIDFFQASLKQEVQVMIPLVFTGIAPAEKDLGGTLNKNMLEIEVKALPQNLPHEITVDVGSLKTFEDHILVKDLALPANVQVLKPADEIVAAVLPAAKIEEELAKEITENVEDVAKVEKPKKEEEVVVEEPKA